MAPATAVVAANSSRQIRTSVAERKRAMMARDEPAHDFGLARRLVCGNAAVAALVRGDVRDDVYALDQQILQPVVNLVDASAQLFEIGRDI